MMSDLNFSNYQVSVLTIFANYPILVQAFKFDAERFSLFHYESFTDIHIQQLQFYCAI